MEGFKRNDKKTMKNKEQIIIKEETVNEKCGT